MSGTHGVFQHRTGYFYTILEEDFCELYKREGVNEVCRAYITSILETLTNKQYDPEKDKQEIWVYMSLPQMAHRMRHACSERTIHKEIQGMIKDGYIFKRRAEGKATMEYRLNLKKIRDGLESLPDKQSCNSATYDLANLQDQSGKSARLTLQDCKNDLAELQPRISNRLPIEEPKKEHISQGAPALVKEKKSRQPKVKEDETMTKRIDTFLNCLDELASEYTGQPFKYPRFKSDRPEVKTLLECQKITQEQVQETYRSMMTSPFWQEHMSVRAFVRNFSREYMKIVSSHNGNGTKKYTRLSSFDDPNFKLEDEFYHQLPHKENGYAAN